MPKDQNQPSELSDIREILGTIVANMVTKKELKEELNLLSERMVTKSEFQDFQRETRQNFRDVRDDIAELKKETDFEFEDLLGRVKYVEEKLGIESGK